MFSFLLLLNVSVAVLAPRQSGGGGRGAKPDAEFEGRAWPGTGEAFGERGSGAGGLLQCWWEDILLKQTIGLCT